MTRNPVFLKPTNNLKDTIEVFANNKVETCPVIGPNKELVGVVSYGDVLRIADIHSKIQESTSKTFPIVIGLLKGREHFESLEEGLKKILTVPVSEFMTKKIKSISPEDDVYDALKIMNEEKINTLPVVKDSKLVGVLSRVDIIEALEKNMKKR